MNRLLPGLLMLGLLLPCGCSANQLNKNPLQNLTEKQAEWFDRTSEGWLF